MILCKSAKIIKQFVRYTYMKHNYYLYPAFSTFTMEIDWFILQHSNSSSTENSLQ